MWYRTRGLVILLIAIALTGCIVSGRSRHASNIPSGQTHVSGQTCWVYSDIEWVVCEYYDWDYDTVESLHSMGYSPDDVCLILFLAYRSQTEPRTIARWRRAGIPWRDITTVNLRLDPSTFFVSIPSNVQLGPPYGRAYGYYRKDPKTVVLSDVERVDLVQLKVVSKAYKIPPVKVIRLRQQGRSFNKIVQAQRKAGKSIRTRKGRIVKAPYKRPSKKPSKIRPDKSQRKPPKNKAKDKPGRGRRKKQTQ